MARGQRGVLRQLNAQEWSAVSAIAAAISGFAALTTAIVALGQMTISADAGRDAALASERTAACREMIGSYAAFEFEAFSFFHQYPNGQKPPGGPLAAEAAGKAYGMMLTTLDADEVYFTKSNIAALHRARKVAMDVSGVIITQSHGPIGGGLPSQRLSDELYEQLSSIKTLCHSVLVR